METEVEFDALERDSWTALAEYEEAVCPHCGNFTVICSTPEGATGDGYNLTQTVCYPTMIRAATQRRIDRMFKKAQPDLHGFLPHDGVLLGVSLFADDSEDLLGLARDDELFAGGDGPPGLQQPEQDQDPAAT